MSVEVTQRLASRVTSWLRLSAGAVVIAAVAWGLTLWVNGYPWPGAVVIGAGLFVCLLLYALVVIVETLLDIAASVSPEE